MTYPRGSNGEYVFLEINGIFQISEIFQIGGVKWKLLGQYQDKKKSLTIASAMAIYQDVENS